MMMIILISIEIGIKIIKLTSINKSYNFYAKFGFKICYTNEQAIGDEDLCLDLSIYNHERIEKLKRNERIDFN